MWRARAAALTVSAISHQSWPRDDRFMGVTTKSVGSQNVATYSALSLASHHDGRRVLGVLPALLPPPSAARGCPHLWLVATPKDEEALESQAGETLREPAFTGAHGPLALGGAHEPRLAAERLRRADDARVAAPHLLRAQRPVGGVLGAEPTHDRRPLLACITHLRVVRRLGHLLV